MTDSNSNTTTSPTFIIHFVPARKGAPWTQIGAMWPTNSGTGHRVVLNFFPAAPGNIVALPFQKQDQEEGA